MNYIAHCDGEREQSILEHLQGTAEKAKDFAEVFEKGDWGYCCGMLHDIGKYSDKFQRRIRGEEIKVDHATAGARVCMELGGMYPFLEMCIAGHHAGLSDYGVSTDTGNSSTTLGRRKKKIEDFYAYKKEVKIPELKTSPVNVEKTKDLNFSLSMFTRMMYSCLVDADFLDTEEFMTEERSGRQQGQEIQVLLDKLEKYITEWLKNTETESVNGRRTEILKACLENGEREKGLFRLTVPTGGGKTVASLAFALRHAVKHHMKRIIYVIPYTSIIEQNAAVFRRILGDENVLENHCNIDYEEAEELKPMQLASENWDKPVVVTTNVQFFESLFSNKSSKCRKLHNMANSVIIFDEAQMLPNDYLKPCLTAIEELVINYKVSAVLCTATQRCVRDHSMQVDADKIKIASEKLKHTLGLIQTCESKAQLRGFEGEAASVYFGVFDEMILQQKKDFSFQGRNKRPPLDNMNAMLSFVYTLLTNTIASSLECVGLDPYVGYLHTERPGRVSLALDMIEELRAVLADRFVLSLVNKKIVNGKNFTKKENGAVLMDDELRKKLLVEWQKKKKETITHPFLKEKVEWGMVPYVQAMLLARYLRGDLDSYPVFLWK